MSLQVVMAPDIRRPGLIQPQIPRYEYPDLNLDELVKGLGSAYETYQYQRGLEEARPKVEEQTETTSRQATPVEQQKAADYTQDVFNREEEDWLEGITDPEEREKERQSYRETLNQGLTRPGEDAQPVQWVDPQASVKQTQTTYKVGNETFYNRPSQELLDIYEMENQARLFMKDDPRLAYSVLDQARKRREDYLNNQFARAIETKDVEELFRLHNDIPDGMGSQLRYGDDGTMQVWMFPDGQPDKAEQVFATKNRDELMRWAAQDISPVTARNAALAQQQRDYQQERDLKQDERNARTDERYARSEARYDRQELLNRAESLENLAKERAVLGDYEEAAKMKREADTLRRQVHGQVSAGGLGGPVTGPTQGSPQEGSIPPAAIYDYLVSKHGVSPAHAVGIVTNADFESGFDPTAIHDSNTGYGMFGHRLDRRDKMFANAGNQNPSWTQQLDYAMTEPEMQEFLSRDYGDDYARATADFTRIFEKPKNTEARAVERARKAPVYADYAQRAVSPGLAGPVTQPPSQGLTASPNQPPAAPPPAPNQPQQGLTAQADDYAMKWARQIGQPKAQGKELTPDQALKLEEEAIMLAQAETPDFGRLSPDAQEQLVAKARQKILAAHAAWNNGGQAGAAAATMTPEQRMKLFTDNLDKIVEALRAQKSK